MFWFWDPIDFASRHEVFPRTPTMSNLGASPVETFTGLCKRFAMKLCSQGTQLQPNDSFSSLQGQIHQNIVLVQLTSAGLRCT